MNNVTTQGNDDLQTNLTEVIYWNWEKPIPPCYFDFLSTLINEGQLIVRQCALPEISKEIREIIKNHPSGKHRHSCSWSDIPYRIYFALHQKGYDYNLLYSEKPFGGWRPDYLAMPCPLQTFWECEKKTPCKECNVGNGLGFIIVEVGTITNLWKIFQTDRHNVDEFWIVPHDVDNDDGKDYYYVFLTDENKEIRWNWLNIKIKKIINEIEKLRDHQKPRSWERSRRWDDDENIMSIINGYGCIEYPNCHTPFENKFCRESILNYIRNWEQ